MAFDRAGSWGVGALSQSEKRRAARPLKWGVRRARGTSEVRVSTSG